MELSLGEEGENEIRAYLFQAIKNNNGAGVLLLSDIFRFKDSLTRDFTYRVACNGYNALIPDMFHGNPWAKDRPQNLFEEWRARKTSERVAKDIETSTNWMVEEFLRHKNDREAITFGAAISFCGTRMNASATANVKIPTLFIWRDEDVLCPVTGLEDIRKTIGGDSRAVIFQGRGHGFTHWP